MRHKECAIVLTLIIKTGQEGGREPDKEWGSDSSSRSDRHILSLELSFPRVIIK